jgi:alpha-galactosidase
LLTRTSSPPSSFSTRSTISCASVGRAILFDVNDAYTSDQPWTWAPAYATLWRTTPDILDAYWYLLRNFRLNVGLYPLAHPGGWNDPDMLEIGNGGMSTTEYVSMFSLWAVMDAPLIAGNDLTTMSATTQSILTNRDVIALDQDPLGRQAYPVASALGHWVLTKPLANGEWAFVLFNETGTPANITAVGTQVGLPHGNRYTWHDLWTGAYSETFGWITATVPAHGVVVYRVSTLF